ncbi:MAG: hypothetical protein AAGC83_10665 [Pseudomonadota bacterium]
MRVFALLVSFVFLSAPAAAQPLTDQSIAQWADSYSAMMDWAESSAIEPDIAPGPDMFKRSMEAMKPEPEFAQIQSILSSHGYGDPMGWAGISDRIFEAYMSIEVDATGIDLQEMQPQIQEMMSELMENPDIPQAQKEEILKSIGVMPDAMEALMPQNVDPADLAAVERNRAVIDAVMERGS